MAKKKEPTVEEKLRALYDLQLIDSRIDKIRDIRGELPLEVKYHLYSWYITLSHHFCLAGKSPFFFLLNFDILFIIIY